MEASNPKSQKIEVRVNSQHLFPEPADVFILPSASILSVF